MRKVNSDGGTSAGVQTENKWGMSQPDKDVHKAPKYASGEQFLMNNQKSNRVNSWITVNTGQKICGWYLKKLNSYKSRCMKLKNQHSLTRQHIHSEVHAQLQDLKQQLIILLVTQIPDKDNEMALNYDAYNLDFVFIFFLLHCLTIK